MSIEPTVTIPLSVASEIKLFGQLQAIGYEVAVNVVPAKAASPGVAKAKPAAEPKAPKASKPAKPAGEKRARTAKVRASEDDIAAVTVWLRNHADGGTCGTISEATELDIAATSAALQDLKKLKVIEGSGPARARVWKLVEGAAS